jgi:hypothetical protein
MKHEYHEVPKARENFQKLARAVFKAPKVTVAKKQPKPKRRKKRTVATGARTVPLAPSLPTGTTWGV